jgi:F420H(2)-dependent quinone reductase
MLQLKNCTRLFMRGAPLLNVPVAALANLRCFGRIVSRNIAILTYTGRRSGRSFSIPVAYRSSGDDLEIAANMPDAKSWWRNFLGDGAPLTVRLDGVERAGHAVARRDERGHVTVRVRLRAS